MTLSLGLRVTWAGPWLVPPARDLVQFHPHPHPSSCPPGTPPSSFLLLRLSSDPPPGPAQAILHPGVGPEGPRAARRGHSQRPPRTGEGERDTAFLGSLRLAQVPPATETGQPPHSHREAAVRRGQLGRGRRGSGQVTGSPEGWRPCLRPGLLPEESGPPWLVSPAAPHLPRLRSRSAAGGPCPVRGVPRGPVSPAPDTQPSGA